MINERRFTLKKDRTLCKNCFCRTPKLIENYEKAVADTTQIWACHHRLETHNSDGERRLVDISKEELIALGMYYDRPPEELIFLTPFEHTSLHKKGKSSIRKGKHISEETKKKISEAMKGKPSPRKGKPAWNRGKYHSEETRRKISETLKGKPKNRQMKHWKLVDGKRVWY